MHVTDDRIVQLESGILVTLPFRARAIRRFGDLVLVLLDPDDYLNDEPYKTAHNSGEPPIRNLIAFDKAGRQMWAAELSETMDYYHSIEDGLPIRALSYSGHRCVIDESNGRIIRREFLK